MYRIAFLSFLVLYTAMSQFAWFKLRIVSTDVFEKQVYACETTRKWSMYPCHFMAIRVAEWRLGRQD
jgi:hypothetical protein